MPTALLLMLLIANAIRLAGSSLGYDMPIIDIADDEWEQRTTTPEIIVGGGGGSEGCSTHIIDGVAFESCVQEENDGLFSTVRSFIISVAKILVFLVNLVLAIVVVPIWLLSLSEIPLELRSGLVVPLVGAYGMILYKAVRRG